MTSRDRSSPHDRPQQPQYGNFDQHPHGTARHPDEDVHPIETDSDATQVIAPIVDVVDEKQHPGTRSRTRKIVLISLLVISLLGGGALIASSLYLRSVDSSVERVDAFTDIPDEERPQKAASEAKNFLMLGSDSRDPDSTGGTRTDTIILAHIPKDRSSAQLISIPRDTWVYIPKAKNGLGGTEAKINAAFAWGGIPLLVRTIEKFTGVRIDNVIVVDFAGFKEVVDALGGVEVTVEQGFTSIHPPYRRFSAGRQEMDGAEALDYTRQRKQFADGDFARIRHQQQVIKAIVNKASTGGTLSSPGKLSSFLDATAGAVAVDSTMSLFDTAMELRHLSGGGLSFYTSPTTGTGRKGSQSVVLADMAKVRPFYQAVLQDDVETIKELAKK